MKLNAKFENKKILLVSAWEPEQHTLKQTLQNCENIHFLLTGIGSLRATQRVTLALAQKKFDLVLFCGTAGAYNSAADLSKVFACQKTLWSDGAVLLGKSYIPPHQNLTETLECTEDFAFKIPHAFALCLPSITTDENLAAECARHADLEHLELFGVALACQEFKIPWSGILGVANIVHKNAHIQWKQNHVNASESAQQELLNLLQQQTKVLRKVSG